MRAVHGKTFKFKVALQIIFLPEEMWGPARSSRPSQLELWGHRLQSREGGVKVSEVCRKAASLAGHCNRHQFCLTPKVYSTEVTMVRLVPGLPAPLRHPGFSIPWQYWRQFVETWLGNVLQLGSPDRAILSPAGKTMAAQKHENTNLLAGGKVCPKVSRIAHQFKTRSQAMSPQLGS